VLQTWDKREVHKLCMEKRDQDQCVGCCETDIPTFSLVNYEWFQYKIKYDGKENKCRKT